MEKIHMIGWALLIIIVGASAITTTVTTEQEAQAKLGSGANLVVGDCEILSIEKTVTEQADFANDWVVTYSQWYTRDGTLSRNTGQVMVKINSEATVKTAVEPACEAKWIEIQAQNSVIDTVIISPTFEQNNAIGAKYDTSKGKKWKDPKAKEIEIE